VVRKYSKRAFDVLLSLTMLVLTLPAFILTALAVWLESSGRGPVFYRQERVGRNGVTFEVLKFRSMTVDAEHDGVPTWATRDDGRVTRVGRFIRGARLDELPQLINVLKGEMSFVGPRPERPEFVETLAERIPYYTMRHRVTPGITGWAQIRYPYGASEGDAREKLEYDLYYIKNYSLFLDLIIIL
jgi:exopolysaccharide biosynthesis polyprenyl glycosylphosphotransferase